MHNNSILACLGNTHYLYLTCRKRAVSHLHSAYRSSQNRASSQLVLIGTVSQVAVDIGAHGFVTTSACNSEAFLCSSACSKDGGDGTCLKNVILELGKQTSISVTCWCCTSGVGTQIRIQHIYTCAERMSDKCARERKLTYHPCRETDNIYICVRYILLSVTSALFALSVTWCLSFQ